MAFANNKSGKILILAPIGRDAATCAALVRQLGLEAGICVRLEDVVDALTIGADVVLLTEEALYGKNLEPLACWIRSQPLWSDQPFVILTNRHEASAFAAFRQRLVDELRNVSFLERPLQTISLQAAVLAAVRGRRRQYQARTFLEEQQGAAAELERLVAERTKALQQANAQLREEIGRREAAQTALMQAQKIETMGQLVGGVAHDFNNLLMAIIGNLDLLSKGLGPDPRLRRLLEGAREGARRGATLTQRLLAFARRQELQTRSTDVAHLVDDMHNLIERSLGPLVKVVIRRQSDPPAISADPNQLEMALLNLAVNARDAMPSGGVLTIDLQTDDLEVQNALGLRPGRYVRVSMGDTGQGMDQETLCKAVEPFFTTKGIGRGTGLGLSMVSGFAGQSGGAFRLNSRIGEGTTASLWLPATSDKPVSVKTPEMATDRGPATILLVDDDALVAASTLSLLEDLGHHVFEANSGRQALDLLESGLEPDLMITDHLMPEMTGAELALHVRSRRPNLPILLATGYAELAGDQASDLPRLAKPYTQTQLSIEIGKLLGDGSAN